ncbi:UDP-glucose 4-epimerase GalE [Aromatoleum aromaticum]|uniref:UDP-glucose 4-epimerase n=1 Tax=Aromatoleum aromaticum (strain DSM 19018 / LMG 30748 / EbN1) TaxID=76114 RepID=Q5P305_AROAE|nr:UDP-glucose 4-epimerase GalE [Aromatoleum aromaticum]NMG53460.1 UDP-glucose 4-epimerase GalE [Aromatoleum aromaticum]CAI08309.1 UDP-glucose 4-epimerase, gene: SP1607 [Aromatoleum aromaticum EbN1]
MGVVLVTGGAGYIGSHTCVELLQSGHDVVVVDNLCNSKSEALARVEQIAGRRLAGFHEIDVRESDGLKAVFGAYRVDAVIHFAALKAVGESVREPLEYYDNNIGGTIALTRAMAEAGVYRLVFSSSATVYGDPRSMPIAESAPAAPTNPYGRTKWMTEQVLSDVAASDPRWQVVLLRYFNPVGAHRSGRIGEDPHGIPNNLMPYISQVAVGRLPQLQVFGGDYATPDGTGVRDYIHVVDLARGHVQAVERIEGLPGVTCLNLGTGRGYSVLEVIRSFEAASGRRVPYRIVDRRPGDIAACWADAGRAEKVLGWKPEHDLDAMCRDAWRWQTGNPEGYPG